MALFCISEVKECGISWHYNWHQADQRIIQNVFCHLKISPTHSTLSNKTLTFGEVLVISLLYTNYEKKVPTKYNQTCQCLLKMMNGHDISLISKEWLVAWEKMPSLILKICVTYSPSIFIIHLKWDDAFLKEEISHYFSLQQHRIKCTIDFNLLCLE